MGKKFWIIVVSLFVLNISSCVYREEFKKIPLYWENSPDSAYTFIYYQVGRQEWAYQKVKAQIRVCDAKGKTLDKVNITVLQDGGRASKYDVKSIHWYDTKLACEIRGSDESVATTYTLSFGKE